MGGASKRIRTYSITMTRRHLVMVNMSTRREWESGIANRNYHVMQTLLASGEFETVVSVDFLPFSFKRRVKQFFKRSKGGGEKVSVGRGARVRRDSSNSALLWVTASGVDRLGDAIERLGFKQEEMVLWLYNPFASELLERFPKALGVFDAVDNWMEHPVYAKRSDGLKEHYARIKRHADAIFTVSEALIDFFDKRSNATYIPNGVDAAHFGSGACALRDTVPGLRPDAQIIGYHGVIQSRVNPAVFQYLAERFPEREIIIVGSIWKEVKSQFAALTKMSNVHLVDAVPYAELPSVVSCFDVAVIPHRVDAFTQTMNPLKVYEYLAAGKPIVSTAVAGADQFQDLIKLAVSPEDFAEKVEKELASDSPEKQQRRMALAQQHGWPQRVGLMIDSLKELEKASQDKEGAV